MTVAVASAAVDRLRAHLLDSVQGSLGELDWMDSIDSTNSELLRRAPRLPDRSVLLADRQTAGRGRRGRLWSQSPGGGLALSLLVRLDLPATALGGLSLAIGVACVEALRAAGADDVVLKWPNDLQARERKLGGLLIELSGSQRAQTELVIGLGLNLRLPADADAGWIDLAPLGLLLTIEEAAALLVPAMLTAVDTFSRSGFAGFSARWVALDALRGRPVRVIAGSDEIHGQALGVTEGGELRVLCEGGERNFSSADVSVRPQ